MRAHHPRLLDFGELFASLIAFAAWLGTAHWPNAQHVGSNVAKRDGKDDPHNPFEPFNKSVLDREGFKSTGIPYIKT